MFRRLRRSQLALSHDRILARQLKRRLWPLRPPPATQTRPFTAIPHHQGGAKRHYEPWRREEGPPKRSPVAEPTIYASQHTGIVQFAMADGAVRPLSLNIDLGTYRSLLAGASDGNVIGEF
jgi:hypothetical protein